MLTLRMKFTALVVGACAGAVALIAGLDIRATIMDAEAATLARQESSLRTVAMALDYARDDISVAFNADGSVGRVAWSAAPTFADHAIIDRVGAATGETATVFVRDPADGEFYRRTTNIVKPDGARAVGTKLGASGPVHPVVAGGGVYRGEAVILGKPYFTVYAPIYGPDGAVDGVLYVGADKTGVAAAWRAAVQTTVIESLLTLSAAAALAWWLVGRAMGLLTRFQASLAALAAGDIRTPVPGQDRKDEIGALARGLETLRENLSAAAAQRADAEAERKATLDALEQGVGAVVGAAVGGDFSARVAQRFAEPQIAALAEGVNRICATTGAFLGDVERAMTAMADGDLTRRVEGAYSGQLAQLGGAVNMTLDRLNGLIAQIQGSADVSLEAVSRIEEGARDLSGRAENQAASLEQTAATMEQMAASVKSNAAALSSADKLAADARAKTAHGADTVAQAVTAVNRIKTSSDQITAIISMIEAIAWQTNLLALNASVEAARAGDAGRGFAVVASEVRALAQRAADAARDIAGLIQTSAENVADGIALVENTGAALGDIRAAMERLAATLGEVSAAGREQATGVEEINSAVTQMDRITQENAALTERFAAEAGTLAGEIGALRDAAAVFAIDQRRAGAARRAA